MSVLEIIATIVLCILGISIVLIWAQIMIISDKIFRRYEEETKKSASEEADEERKK